jgi:hypothetical protein
MEERIIAIEKSIKNLSEIVEAGFAKCNGNFETIGVYLEKAFEKIDKLKEETTRRFDDIENRFDGLEKRFDGLERMVGHQTEYLATEIRKINVVTDYERQLKNL